MKLEIFYKITPQFELVIKGLLRDCPIELSLDLINLINFSEGHMNIRPDYDFYEISISSVEFIHNKFTEQDNLRVQFNRDFTFFTNTILDLKSKEVVEIGSSKKQKEELPPRFNSDKELIDWFFFENNEVIV